MVKLSFCMCAWIVILLLCVASVEGKKHRGLHHHRKRSKVHHIIKKEPSLTHRKPSLPSLAHLKVAMVAKKRSKPSGPGRTLEKDKREHPRVLTEEHSRRKRSSSLDLDGKTRRPDSEIQGAQNLKGTSMANVTEVLDYSYDNRYFGKNVFELLRNTTNFNLSVEESTSTQKDTGHIRKTANVTTLLEEPMTSPISREANESSRYIGNTTKRKVDEDKSYEAPLTTEPPKFDAYDVVVGSILFQISRNDTNANTSNGEEEFNEIALRPSRSVDSTNESSNVSVSLVKREQPIKPNGSIGNATEYSKNYLNATVAPLTDANSTLNLLINKAMNNSTNSPTYQAINLTMQVNNNLTNKAPLHPKRRVTNFMENSERPMDDLNKLFVLIKIKRCNDTNLSIDSSHYRLPSNLTIPSINDEYFSSRVNSTGKSILTNHKDTPVLDVLDNFELAEKVATIPSQTPERHIDLSVEENPDTFEDNQRKIRVWNYESISNRKFYPRSSTDSSLKRFTTRDTTSSMDKDSENLSTDDNKAALNAVYSNDSHKSDKTLMDLEGPLIFKDTDIINERSADSIHIRVKRDRMENDADLKLASDRFDSNHPYESKIYLNEMYPKYLQDSNSFPPIQELPESRISLESMKERLIGNSNLNSTPFSNSSVTYIKTIEIIENSPDFVATNESGKDTGEVVCGFEISPDEVDMPKRLDQVSESINRSNPSGESNNITRKSHNSLSSRGATSGPASRTEDNFPSSDEKNSNWAKQLQDLYPDDDLKKANPTAVLIRTKRISDMKSFDDDYDYLNDNDESERSNRTMLLTRKKRDGIESLHDKNYDSLDGDVSNFVSQQNSDEHRMGKYFSNDIYSNSVNRLEDDYPDDVEDPLHPIPIVELIRRKRLNYEKVFPESYLIDEAKLPNHSNEEEDGYNAYAPNNMNVDFSRNGDENNQKSYPEDDDVIDSILSKVEYDDPGGSRAIYRRDATYQQFTGHRDPEDGDAASSSSNAEEGPYEEEDGNIYDTKRIFRRDVSSIGKNSENLSADSQPNVENMITSNELSALEVPFEVSNQRVSDLPEGLRSNVNCVSTELSSKRGVFESRPRSIKSIGKKEIVEKKDGELKRSKRKRKSTKRMKRREKAKRALKGKEEPIKGAENSKVTNDEKGVIQTEDGRLKESSKGNYAFLVSNQTELNPQTDQASSQNENVLGASVSKEVESPRMISNDIRKIIAKDNGPLVVTEQKELNSQSDASRDYKREATRTKDSIDDGSATMDNTNTGRIRENRSTQSSIVSDQEFFESPSQASSNGKNSLVEIDSKENGSAVGDSRNAENNTLTKEVARVAVEDSKSTLQIHGPTTFSSKAESCFQSKEPVSEGDTARTKKSEEDGSAIVNNPNTVSAKEKQSSVGSETKMTKRNITQPEESKLISRSIIVDPPIVSNEAIIDSQNQVSSSGKTSLVTIDSKKNGSAVIGTRSNNCDEKKTFKIKDIRPKVEESKSPLRDNDSPIVSNQAHLISVFQLSSIDEDLMRSNDSQVNTKQDESATPDEPNTARIRKNMSTDTSETDIPRRDIAQPIFEESKFILIESIPSIMNNQAVTDSPNHESLNTIDSSVTTDLKKDRAAFIESTSSCSSEKDTIMRNIAQHKVEESKFSLKENDPPIICNEAESTYQNQISSNNGGTIDQEQIGTRERMPNDGSETMVQKKNMAQPEIEETRFILVEKDPSIVSNEGIIDSPGQAKGGDLSLTIDLKKDGSAFIKSGSSDEIKTLRRKDTQAKLEESDLPLKGNIPANLNHRVKESNSQSRIFSNDNGISGINDSEVDESALPDNSKTIEAKEDNLTDNIDAVIPKRNITQPKLEEPEIVSIEKDSNDPNQPDFISINHESSFDEDGMGLKSSQVDDSVITDKRSTNNTEIEVTNGSQTGDTSGVVDEFQIESRIEKRDSSDCRSEVEINKREVSLNPQMQADEHDTAQVDDNEIETSNNNDQSDISPHDGRERRRTSGYNDLPLPDGTISEQDANTVDDANNESGKLSIIGGLQSVAGNVEHFVTDGRVGPSRLASDVKQSSWDGNNLQSSVNELDAILHEDNREKLLNGDDKSITGVGKGEALPGESIQSDHDSSFHEKYSTNEEVAVKNNENNKKREILAMHSRVKRHDDDNHKDLEAVLRQHYQGKKDQEMRYYDDVHEPDPQLHETVEENPSTVEKLRNERAAKSVEEVKALMEKLVAKVDELQKYVGVNNTDKVVGKNREDIDDARSNTTFKKAVDDPKEVRSSSKVAVNGTAKSNTTEKIQTKGDIKKDKKRKESSAKEKRLGKSASKKRSTRMLRSRQPPREGRRKRKSHRKWDRWTDWSSCSVTCGKGRQIRWRHCVHECTTAETEMEEKACQLPACGPGKFLGIF